VRRSGGRGAQWEAVRLTGTKNEHAATRRSAGGVGGESGFKQIL